MKNIKYEIVVAIIGILVYPSVTLASWWNPLSWRVLKSSREPKVEIVAPATPTTRATNKTEANIKPDKPKEKKKSVEPTKKQEVEKPKVETTPYVPLQPFVPPIGAITPPETPVFAVQAADGTIWQGFSKKEAQEKANHYMNNLDRTPPYLYFDKMIQRQRESPFFIKNDNALYGTIGLWKSSIAEDPQPSSGKKNLEYYLDGVLIGADTNFDGKIPLDTTKYSNGIHILSIKVYDNAGNVASDSAEITIKN
ncbi:hypothetical protein A3I90_01340 [Candidatus Nomurabacteria bacterium RIFCSPLOWO2_02_FULL_41_9]|nr:MAG: hypothetical protein A3B01_01700 [Candidatus Nomurabacteria bacterium RIFCSPLOWO2_01_FULL_41_52b]OGJ00352.1 MAG: hypothetical protein A3I90_01340 [Candidatus Nomurabacteria bacterium RIFCSPLOWO2_02_FULL_41_9]